MARLPRSPGVQVSLPVVSLQGTGPSAEAAGAVGGAVVAAADMGGRLAQAAAQDAQAANLKRDRLKAAQILADTRVDLTRQLLAAQEGAQPGADGFTADWKALQDKATARALAAMPESVRAEFAIDMTGLAGQLEGSALTFEARERLAHNKELTAGIADSYANAVALDPGQLDSALDQWALAVDASGLPETAIPGVLKAGEATIAEAAVRSLNDSDPEATRDMLAQGMFNDLLGPDRLEVLRNDNATAIARLEAERRARQAEAAASVSGVLDLLRSGYNVAPELLTQARNNAAPYPELASQLSNAEALSSFSASLLASPPETVQATVASLRETIARDGATPQSAAALEIAQSVADRMATELPRDPLAFYVSTGLVSLAPLDPSNPDALAARVGAAQVAEAASGRPALPFTEMEIDSLAQAWRAADSAGQMAIVENLIGPDMPPEMRGRLLDRISGEDPLMGLVTSWAETGDAERFVTARDTLRGRELLDANPDLKPSTTDRQMVLSDVLGGALVADTTGQWRSALIEAADGLYAASLGGQTPEAFDSDAYEEALARATGGLTDINGRVTFLPPGMDEDAFDTWRAGLTDADLQGPAGATPNGPHVVTADGLAPISADDAVNDWQMIPIGPGQYLLGVEIGGRVEYAVTPAGGLYILEAP